MQACKGGGGRGGGAKSPINAYTYNNLLDTEFRMSLSDKIYLKKAGWTWPFRLYLPSIVEEFRIDIKVNVQEIFKPNLVLNTKCIVRQQCKV